MNVVNLLSTQRIVCGAQVASKKRVLERLSHLIAEAVPSLTQTEVFESFLARERLGSTGLGFGVAIPHGRMDDLDTAVGAFIQLADGVEYDAIDQQPVDLLFALLVPQEATDEHLQILANLAEMFKDANLRQQLRDATTADELLTLLARGSSSEYTQAASQLG